MHTVRTSTQGTIGLQVVVAVGERERESERERENEDEEMKESPLM